MANLVKIQLNKKIEINDVNLLALVIKKACGGEGVNLENFLASSDNNIPFISFEVCEGSYGFYMDFDNPNYKSSSGIFALSEESGKDSLAVEITAIAMSYLLGDAVTIDLGFGELSEAIDIVELTFKEMNLTISKTTSLDLCSTECRLKYLYEEIEPRLMIC